MALIDLTYFTGEILVAQRSQPEVQEDLTRLIAKYEPKVLTDLFGKTMYKQFVDGLAVLPTPEAKWTNLLNGVAGEWMGLTNAGKLSLIANYVYCMWCRKENTQTTGIGTVVPKAENAQKIAPVDNYVRAWNEMVSWNCELHSYIRDHASDYPDYQYADRDDLCRCSSKYYFHCGCRREKPELFSITNHLGL